jgi:hypothetical protein
LLRLLCVEIEWDREIAIGRIGDAQSTADVVEYSEASGREGDPHSKILPYAMVVTG